MSLLHRSPLIVILLVAMCPAWSAASGEQDTLQQRKMDAIHAALPLATNAVSGDIVEEAAARATALISTQIDSTDSKQTIVFDFSAPPLYSARIHHDSSRVIIDFVDSILLPDLQTLRIDGGKTSLDIHTELVAIHPRFVTRATIQLDSPQHYAITLNQNILTVTLDPKRAADTAKTHQGTGLAELATSAIQETLLRSDAQLRYQHKQLAEKLAAATQHIQSANVAMIQFDLSEITPDQNTPTVAQDIDSLRDQLSAHTNTTSQLERKYRRLNANRDAAQAQAHAEIQANGDNTNAITSALTHFAQSEKSFAQSLRALQSELDKKIGVNAMLASRIDRQFAADHPKTHKADAGLDQLDLAFTTLRQTDTPDIAVASSFAAFDQAMDTVSAAALNLSLENEIKHAAMTNNVSTYSSAPPIRRTRTAPRELNLNAIENPTTMAVLSSSNDALRRAEANGVIVLAQRQTSDSISDAQGEPATPVDISEPTSGPRRFRVPKTSGVRPEFDLYNEGISADQDPLRQLVNIDFRDMDLTNVVALLAQKGEINVIAGTEVTGTVTANLRNIPLGRAIEIVLRMNGFGILEEAGVYRITSYEESISAQRETKMIFLKNSQAEEIKATLEDVLAGSINGNLVSVSANAATNVIIVSGPREVVTELEGVVAELDVSEPVIPTITLPIKLNYSEPSDLLPVVLEIVTENIGSVTADPRSRHLIVTDIPVKVQEIEALVRSIDLPVKQVSIDAMIVDAQLADDAQTGLDWLIKSDRGKEVVTSSTVEVEDGVPSSNSEADFLSKIGGGAALLPEPLTAGTTLFFNVLSGDLDLTALIAAQVDSNNAKLLANPSVVTVENKPAIIRITQDFPYQELTQTSEGGSIGSTKFKEIGTILEVTPRVTHDNNIITAIDAKESTVVDFLSGVPIEAKRQAQTTLRMSDGQTIFIGGLRSYDERLLVNKVPILGDIPILNFLFSNKRSQQTNTELMIFLTCNVLPEIALELTPYEKGRFDELGGTPWKVDGTKALAESYIHPERQRDPIYKWRRGK